MPLTVHPTPIATTRKICRSPRSSRKAISTRRSIRRCCSRNRAQLVYVSAPFEQDQELSGFFRFEAWLSIDQPDTDFVVTVAEIGTDGTVTPLSSDVMRARYRETLRSQKLVTTKEPLRYDFENFTFASRRVAKGSRLQLVLSAANSIEYEKNYNSGGRDRGRDHRGFARRHRGAFPRCQAAQRLVRSHRCPGASGRHPMSAGATATRQRGCGALAFAPSYSRRGRTPVSGPAAGRHRCARPDSRDPSS